MLTKISLLATAFLVSISALSQSSSSTYTAGAIPLNLTSYSSTCNGPVTPLVVNIPAGATVTGIDIVYDITAASGAWMSEQQSQIHCQETGNTEATVSGTGGNLEGTESYSRMGVGIANGVSATGVLTFEMQAWRTWGGTGCNNTYQTVNNSTWMITVYYTNPVAMTYVSSTITQASTATVENCAASAEILGVEVVMNGGLSPLNITQFTVGTTGTTNIGEVSSISIYYTGNSATYSPSNLFASVAPGGTVNINGSQVLSSGTNFFWVVYNLTAPTIGNMLDGNCTNIVIGGSGYTPSVTSPAGSRTIVPCDPSPGSLGYSNLTAWWKADDLGLGNVTSWPTSYPAGGSAITLSDGASPYSTATNTPTSSIFNYNTVVDFNGNSGTNQKQLTNTSALNLLSNQNSGNEGTFFIVFANPISGADDGVMTYKNYPDGIQMRGWGRLAIGHNDSPNGTRNFSPAPATEPLIISYKGNKSSGSSMTAFRNDMEYTTSSASSALMEDGVTFGAKRSSLTSYNEYFSGFISEVIFYDADLSNANINIVKTYLAIKYGTTLDNTGGGVQGDYTGTDGATIWDASFSAGYHNDVIGIGRDDSEGLLQKQSHTFDDITRVYVGGLAASNLANTGSIASSSSYVVVGHDTGDMCATATSNTEIPTGLANCTLYSRLEREWKVTKTNFGQTFNADFTLDACANLISVNPAELRLLVDDDGDFSNGGTTCYYNGDGTGIVISYNSPVVTVSNIGNTHLANNTTRFITLASILNTTPLPVTLATFDVESNGCSNLISWSTNSEQNTSQFVVERSFDMATWEDVAKTEAAGNSSTLLDYLARDNSFIQNGVVYYRLRTVDLDGSMSYSEIKAVDCFCENYMKPIIYPNPTNGHMFVETLNQGLIEIYSVHGGLVRRETLSEGKNSFDLSELSSGVYLIKMTIGEELIFIERLVKK